MLISPASMQATQHHQNETWHVLEHDVTVSLAINVLKKIGPNNTKCTDSTAYGDFLAMERGCMQLLRVFFSSISDVLLVDVTVEMKVGLVWHYKLLQELQIVVYNLQELSTKLCSLIEVTRESFLYHPDFERMIVQIHVQDLPNTTVW